MFERAAERRFDRRDVRRALRRKIVAVGLGGRRVDVELLRARIRRVTGRGETLHVALVVEHAVFSELYDVSFAADGLLRRNERRGLDVCGRLEHRCCQRESNGGGKRIRT